MTARVDIAFPFRVDARGRTSLADPDRHVRDLVEQVLFTAPGERVNRPAFGTNVTQLMFEPARSELLTATQMLVQGSLQQWLGEILQVEEVAVEAVESAVHVTVRYRLRASGEPRVAELERRL